MKPRSLFDTDAWVSREFKATPRPRSVVVLPRKPEPEPEPNPEKGGLKPEPFTPVFKLPEGKRGGFSPSVRKIIMAVSRISEVQAEHILGKCRMADIVKVRQTAYWLARRFAGRSLPALGMTFYRDHTTVLHGIRAVDALIADKGIAPSEDTVEAWAEALLGQYRAERERRFSADADRRRAYARDYARRRRAEGRPARSRTRGPR